MSLLVKNALVVTQDAQRRVFGNCDVFVKGNAIAKVGRNLKEKADSKVDAKGKILIPGLINTHTHSAMTLFRGYGEGLPLKDWLEKRIWPAEKKLKKSDVYDGSMLACAEMLRSGTTAFADMYFHQEETAKAVIKAGLRATLAFTVMDFLGEARKQVAQAKKVLLQHPKTERVRLSVGPHSIYSCSRELLEETARVAAEAKALVQMHLSETKGEVSDCLQRTGKKPAFYLNSLGLAEARLLAAHCVWVDQTEIDLLAQKRVAVSLNPVSNLKLASGVAPARRLIENRVTVSLGTDGPASNNSLSMLETMKFASLVYGLSAQEALDLATLGGARALHLNAGSIEEGKMADFVLMDANALGVAPLHDPVASVVFSATDSSVSDVVVDGKMVVKNKRLLTLNEKKVVEKARKASARLTS